MGQVNQQPTMPIVDPIRLKRLLVSGVRSCRQLQCLTLGACNHGSRLVLRRPRTLQGQCILLLQQFRRLEVFFA